MLGKIAIVLIALCDCTLSSNKRL